MSRNTKPPFYSNDWIVARRYLCFPACCQIAAKAVAGLSLDQIEMANYLGDSVPTEQARESLKADGVPNVQIDPGPYQVGYQPGH